LFCKDIAETFGVDAVGVENGEQAVRKADIIVTCSTSSTPVLKGEWLQAGAHLNAIGSHTPNARELDSTTIRNAKVIVDSRDAALKECGDILIPISEGIIDANHIYAELGEIVTGKKAGRDSGSEVTLFKSQGLAIQDISTASRVYDTATKRQIGFTGGRLVLSK
jgi:ornithine cyclodeaminase/alanine dehydrogenase-like protein (mu-crystallin family)